MASAGFVTVVVVVVAFFEADDVTDIRAPRRGIVAAINTPQRSMESNPSVQRRWWRSEMGLRERTLRSGEIGEYDGVPGRGEQMPVAEALSSLRFGK